MPTIKVGVSPARRKSRATNEKKKKSEKENNEKTIKLPTINYDSPEMKVQRLMEGIESSPEEYVPPELPNQTKVDVDLKYVPSRKSILKRMRQARHFNANEYTPTSTSKSNCLINDNDEIYVPNPITSIKQNNHETYEPSGITNLPNNISETYIPSSKGLNNNIIEEYQPDFATKTMKFDNSYVPSSKKHSDTTQNVNVKKKNIRKERIAHDQRQQLTKKAFSTSKTKREL